MSKFTKFKRGLDKQNDRKIRVELRAERKRLKERIRKLKKKTRPTLRKVREACKRSKARTTALAAKVREAHRAQANAEIAELRKASRGSCETRTGKTKGQATKRIKELEREIRDNQARERLLFRSKGKLKTKQPPKSESNEAVARNLDAELVPVWGEMAQAFPLTSSHMSRTEAFLHWVHDNPGEVTELQASLAEAAAERDIESATEIDRRIVAMLKRNKVTQADLDALKIDCEQVEDLGLACDDPGDVEAAHAALNESDRA